MKPVKIIVNPTAGKGTAEKAIPQVEEMLKALPIPFEMIRTRAPGHGIELARQAAEAGAETVAAMGGDGTVNEVITGLMQNKMKSKYAPALAVFTVGRGNDFAYGVSIPHDLKENCNMLIYGECRTIDIGRVSVDGANEIRYFGNGIGIGFDAVVGFEAQNTFLPPTIELGSQRNRAGHCVETGFGEAPWKSTARQGPTSCFSRLG